MVVSIRTTGLEALSELPMAEMVATPLRDRLTPGTWASRVAPGLNPSLPSQAAVWSVWVPVGSVRGQGPAGRSTRRPVGIERSGAV